MKKIFRGHHALFRPLSEIKNYSLMLATLMVFLSSFQLQAADTAKDGRLTVSFENASFREVVSYMESNSNYRFFYNNGTLNSARNITVSLSGVAADEALLALMREAGLSFKVVGEQVVLKKRSSAKSVSEIFKTTVEQPVAMINKPVFSDTSPVIMAEYVITGKVTSETGEPLPGVNVIVKGTTIGTTTDSEGLYRLALEDGTRPTLVFTFIGYTPKEIEVTGQSVIDVTMDPDIEQLEEVVVVGYGTMKKVNLTGAVSQIEAKDLQDRPVSNLTQALQGTIPNLNVTFGSGKPGQSGTLNVRGTTSINNASPLVLIDGVPGDIDRINTADVESVSVLKDASASAVYGARAAFGVILVTTKKAKEGKPTISYSNNFGFKTHLTNTDFITSGYWNAKINDDAMYNALGNTNTRYTQEDYDELYARIGDKTEHPDRPWVVVKPNANGQDMYRYYANFDWFNYLFNKWRNTQQHNVSISGATDKVRYLISGNQTGEEGIWRINTDQYKRHNLRTRIEVDLNPWVKVSNNTRYFKSRYDWHGLENNFPTVTNDLAPNHLYHFMAAYVPRNPDGTLTGYTGINSYSVGYGMHAIMENGKSKGANNENELASTFEAVVTPFKGFRITGNYTYGQENYADFYRAVRVQYSKFPGVLENFALGNLNKDQLKENLRTNQYHVINIYGNYEKTMGDHYMSLMAGFNQEERTFKTMSATGSELLSETLNDMNLATGEPIIGGGASEWALRGAFYRVNYDFKGKYLFEASGRYDGTSRFSKSDRFGFFPSFSAGWVASEEGFFSGLKGVVNHLKLRYSYGTLGNQDVATYAYISSMSTGRINYLVDDQPIKTINNPAPVAPSLTWERSVTNNVGLDAIFLDNRLSLSADAYVRKTLDMLTLGKKLPSVFGAGEPRENAADLKTTGFELAVNWRDDFDLGGKPFTYSVGAVLADYTAEITKFDNPNRLISSHYVGQKLGDIWGYIYDGFFATTQEAQEYAAIVNQDPINRRRVQAPTAELKKLQAGDIKILDLDGNGIINTGANTVDDPGDRRIIGNSQPRYTFGLNLGGNWNNFDIALFFQGVGKQNWYPHLESQQFWHAYARPYGSFLPADFQDKIWSPENPNSYFPLLRGYIAQNSELSQANNMYLQDIGYVRMKNISIGYNVPVQVLGKIRAERLRIYVSGENLKTWTKLDTDYLDPEEVMVDPTGRTYPMAKTYSVGLQLTF